MPGLINLTGNSKKREQRIPTRYGDKQVREVYIDFFILEDKHPGEKRSTECVPGGHNPPGRARQAWRPWCIVPARVRFLEVSYFPIFLNIPKLIENIFADFSESVYLPYHVPPYFHDSGVFRKYSFMCSGVKVWIILLSILIGVPEI